MSNMSITIRNQINAGSGKRAHPEHLKALAATKKEGQGRVRVEPTNEALRHVLRHPNGMAFRAQGTVEWPWDRFTQRRLRDGSIRVVEQADARKAAAEKPKEERKGQEKVQGEAAARESNFCTRDQCRRFRIASSSSVSASRASVNSRERNFSARLGRRIDVLGPSANHPIDLRINALDAALSDKPELDQRP